MLLNSLVIINYTYLLKKSSNLFKSISLFKLSLFKYLLEKEFDMHDTIFDKLVFWNLST